MADEKTPVQQRLENTIYGTPKIKPDEQRKFLGTFRERVCLTISVAELKEQDWSKAITEEINRQIGQIMFLNGNLPDNILRPYIKLATQHNFPFTLKTEADYKTNPESLAIVIAAKSAVYQSPVDVKKRYPEFIVTPLINQKDESNSSSSPLNLFKSWFQKRKKD